MKPLRTSAFVVLLAGLVPFACGGDSADPLELHGSAEIFPGFNYDTGMQPAGSPVAADFAVTAKGTAKVTSQAVAADDSELYGVKGGSKVALSGGFGFSGKLHIDVAGFNYDGDIPGIENVNIPISGSKSYSPFAIGKDVVATAPIPATQLPKIPLPGGIPGSLVLTVADGSSVTVTWHPKCAGVSGSSAEYEGTIARSGTLVVKPSIEIEIPVKGTQTFDIPEITLPFDNLGTSDLKATAKVGELGDVPDDGVKADHPCKKSDGGGSGSGGGATTGAGGAGATSTTTGSTTGTMSTTTTSSGGDTCAMPTSTADCASCPDQLSCYGNANTPGCCDKANPDGYYAVQSIFINDCGCMMGAWCYDQCSGPNDICVTQNTISDACQTCLQGVSDQAPCLAQFKSDVAANPDAKDYSDCAANCPTN